MHDVVVQPQRYRVGRFPSRRVGGAVFGFLGLVRELGKILLTLDNREAFIGDARRSGLDLGYLRGDASGARRRAPLRRGPDDRVA